MRVVFTCVPQAGHVTPLLPLAESFAAAGDEVVFASGRDAEETARRRGLGFVEIGPGFDEWYAALRGRTRGVPGDGLAPDRVERYFIPRLFGEVGTALTVDRLLAACRELAPDLLVFDPLLFAAPLVATVAGVRAVQHSIGPLVDPVVFDLVADAVSPIWREFGLDVPTHAGVYEGTTLTICPPSLDPLGAALPGSQPMRPTPLPDTPPAPLPVPLPAADRPLVYVTLGTFSNTNLALFRLLVETLADEPVAVLVTVGRDNDPADLAPLPSNTRVERFVPQQEVLPHCTAVVHHAGAGTTFGVLAHALPAVAVPQSADNFRIAARLMATGSAHTLMPAEVTADTLRQALHSVLDNPGYRDAARRLAAEIAAMPAPEEVVASLHLAARTATAG